MACCPRWRPRCPCSARRSIPGIHQKAAVLISAINHNHPLLDGNKRLSWFVTVAFYDINGYDLRADAEDADRYHPAHRRREPTASARRRAVARQAHLPLD